MNNLIHLNKEFNIVNPTLLSKCGMNSDSVLNDKIVCDLVNGLEVLKDHNKVAKSREGIGSRVVDSFTGKGTRRQNIINEGLIHNVENLRKVSKYIIDNQTQSNLAIEKTFAMLIKTQSKIKSLDAGYREEFISLDEKIEQVKLSGRMKCICLGGYTTTSQGLRMRP